MGIRSVLTLGYWKFFVLLRGKQSYVSYLHNTDTPWHCFIQTQDIRLVSPCDRLINKYVLCSFSCRDFET